LSLPQNRAGRPLTQAMGAVLRGGHAVARFTIASYFGPILVASEESWWSKNAMRRSRVGFFLGAGMAAAACGFIFGVAVTTPLWAQTTIDAAKITCDELTSARVAPPSTIVAWISGYLGAKRDSTIVDPAALRNRVRELRRYCYQQKNFKTPVMKAIEELFG